MLAAHPYAEIFPLLDTSDLASLTEDVRQHGLREKITLLDGQILDGRNRYQAAVAAGIIADDESPEDCPSAFTKFVRDLDGDPLAFVISRNLKRRHLNDDQRRMVAARLANMRPGRPLEIPADCGDIKVADAARMVNADEAGTERARAVLAHAEPEITAAVDRGKLTVAAATQAAKLQPETQRKIAERAHTGDANAARSVIKQESRAAKERTLGAKIAAIPDGKFGVIYADPPWRFEPYSRETGMDRAADNHYLTETLETIYRTHPVTQLAAPDCVLFLWATVPMLQQALACIAEWGFEYRSHCIWVKDKIGTGYWFRNQHEILLVAVRGKIPAPAPGTQPSSVFVGDDDDDKRHSAKPQIFLEMIETLFPTLPKVELNRRGPPREGWSAWGNEVSDAASRTAAEPAGAILASATSAGSPSFDEDIPDFLRRT